MIVRDYHKGDIFVVVLSAKEQYQMQYLREDVLMASPAWTGVDEHTGDIIGCAGLAHMWDGVYEAWIALDINHKNEYVGMLKYMKLHMDNLPGVVRIHAHINVNTENYHKFMTFLGFEEEARLVNYFPGKTDCILYRRLY